MEEEDDRLGYSSDEGAYDDDEDGGGSGDEGNANSRVSRTGSGGARSSGQNAPRSTILL